MSANWIDYLKSVDTPTLANAIELLELRPRHEGFTPLSIRCVFPEFGRMAGYAVTAHAETMTKTGPLDLGQFMDLYKLVEASPKPAVVVIQEIGGQRDHAVHCGEVMATIFGRLGAVGLVSDCAVRDLQEVRALGFQYFARGVAASHGHFRIVRTGVPVQIEGLAIHPGDLLHGDENGLLHIPAGIEGTLPAKVEAVRSREGRLMQYVRSPQFRLEELHGKMVE
ncbi:MAG: RraA family protein [Bryobacteraceae bacterium]